VRKLIAICSVAVILGGSFLVTGTDTSYATEPPPVTLDTSIFWTDQGPETDDTDADLASTTTTTAPAGTAQPAEPTTAPVTTTTTTEPPPPDPALDTTDPLFAMDSATLTDDRLGATLFSQITSPYKTYVGADRYETAILLSQAAYPNGAPAVVLTTGENFPDAMVGSPLAAAYGGPLLLTSPTSLSSRVVTELKRLNPQAVFLVGLPSALVAKVKAALPNLPSGQPVLLTGRDRYQTAWAVAKVIKAKLGTVTGVVIAPGDKFPDGLAAAALAASKGWPIVLTPTAGPLPQISKDAIVQLGVTSGIEVGTYASPGLSSFRIAKRIVGKDRYDTCAQIAEYAAVNGLSFRHLGVTTGEKFPDALAAGPYLARDDGILLLSPPNGSSAYTTAAVNAHASEVQQLDFIGLNRTITTPPPTSTTTTTIRPTTTTIRPTTTTVPGATTTTVPPVISGYNASSPVYLNRQSVVANASFSGGSTPNSEQGIYGWGLSSATVRHVYGSHLAYLVKIGSGDQSYNLTMDDVVSRNTCQGIFLANVSDSTFTNLDLDCTPDGPWWSGKPHCLYLERGCHNLSFKNVVLTGTTAGQAFHAYNETDQPSSGLVIDGMTIGTPEKPVRAFVISSGWSNVTIRNLKIYAVTNEPVLLTYGASTNVTIDGFEIWGGNALVGAYPQPELGKAVNWTIKNGIYHGSTLRSSYVADWFVTDPIGENVTLAP